MNSTGKNGGTTGMREYRSESVVTGQEKDREREGERGLVPRKKKSQYKILAKRQ